MNNPMFHTVLVANRGEIARRIIRTLDRLGIRSVAVYSESERDAPHVREATEAVCIGPDPATTSYLDIERIIGAATGTGAGAIHPGYGFLAENLAFATACADAGIVFIGPGTHALDLMGDKARSRTHVAEHGVPIVPGFTVGTMREEDIARAAEKVGYPLLIKPSAGGGGKGMEEVHDAAQLPEALASARRVARSAFGDDELVIERLIEAPRHIEVQVFADTHGTTLALGERECTLQRRHQKIIEEAPSTALDDATRTKLCEAAVNAARSVDYVGAGTVEFLIDAQRPTEFSFIEMNTRLQVEHPVTEAVTGIDLVEWQLLVAAGGQLPELPAHTPHGHAVEARIYAESPETGFLPSVGTVLHAEFGRGVRVDSAVETGSDVSPHYDPMIAKLIAHGPTRDAALDRLDRALADTVILGVNTNIAFLRTLLADERVRSGHLTTGLIDTLLPVTAPQKSHAALAAAATALAPTHATCAAAPPWNTLTGWRMNHEPAPAEPFVLRDEHGNVLRIPPNTTPARVLTAADPAGGVWVGEAGHSAHFTRLSRRDLLTQQLADTGHGPGSGPECLAPMPGTVTLLHVHSGDEVAAGDALVSVEAMKMEHAVTAPHAGTVTLNVTAGEQVQRDTVVATVTPETTPEPETP